MKILHTSDWHLGQSLLTTKDMRNVLHFVLAGRPY